MKTIRILSAIFISLSFINSWAAKTKVADIEWSHYNSDSGSSKFSSANLINAKNVKKLKQAWDWSSIDNAIVKSKNLITSYNEGTPIMVDRTLYLSTSLNQVVALNPKNGKLLWSYDPQVYKKFPSLLPGGKRPMKGPQAGPVNQGFVQRGIEYWKSEEGETRLFLSTNHGYVHSIDAKTGLPDLHFGKKGRINLRDDLEGKAANKNNYGNTSPAIVCKDTLVVGSSVLDFFFNKGMPRGDIRGFDAKTGALKWTFHTIPMIGEYGVDTWLDNSWVYTGNTNVWAPMSADSELGMVYLPISTPSNDFYGGERLGDNLFGESLVSLDCETGVRQWHFQMVHHGLWDYDLPAAPVLMDVKENGKTRKLVAQVSKQAFAYVFDRVTGKPYWPIEERPVPASDVPGEQASLTQPFPTKPLPFDRQGVTEDNLIDFTPELKKEALKIVSKYKIGPIFTPPSEQGTIGLPGLTGGGSWAGAAYNPVTQTLYVPSITKPNIHKLAGTFLGLGYYKYIRDILSPTEISGPEGLPLMKPPYGRVTAINMLTGEQSWMQAVGFGPRDHEALKDLHIKENLGWPRRVHVLTTPDLVFAIQDGIIKRKGVTKDLNGLTYSIENHEPYIRAYSALTGELVAEIEMPKNSFGSPMTYVIDGKQYLVMAYGGANLKSGFMAYSL